jgi:hypothetical protein
MIGRATSGSAPGWLEREPIHDQSHRIYAKSSILLMGVWGLLLPSPIMLHFVPLLESRQSHLSRTTRDLIMSWGAVP